MWSRVSSCSSSGSFRRMSVMVGERNPASACCQTRQRFRHGLPYSLSMIENLMSTRVRLHFIGVVGWCWFSAVRLAPCGLHCPEKSICVTLIRRPIPRTLSGLYSIRAGLLSPQSPSTSKHRRVCNVISGLIIERHVQSTTRPPIRPGHAWFPLHRYTFPNNARLSRSCHRVTKSLKYVRPSLHVPLLAARYSLTAMISCGSLFRPQGLSDSWQRRARAERSDLGSHSQPGTERYRKGTPEVNGLWFDRPSCHPTLIKEDTQGLQNSLTQQNALRVFAADKPLLV